MVNRVHIADKATKRRQAVGTRLDTLSQIGVTSLGGDTASWRMKSIVLDQAYDEYCRLRASGVEVNLDEFSRRWPRYQHSLRMLLDVHQFIDSNPSLVADAVEQNWPAVSDDYLGFTLLEELGRGGFACVFLAAENALAARPVAVKIASNNIGEAETIARLKHRSIVPIHSVRSDPETGRTLICMPFLGRATLCDVLDAIGSRGVLHRARPILEEVLADDTADHIEDPSPDTRSIADGSYVDYVLQLGAQLADALAHTHAMGICHGDLKPPNILLVGNGRPMLLDFNLSVQIGDESRLGGTLPYIAPEQLRALQQMHDGRSWEALDYRCDLFSLGVILYELLSGELPFGPVPREASVFQAGSKLLQKQEQGPRPLSGRNPALDRRTCRLIEQCLQFDPSKRPQSAAGLAKQLRSAASQPARVKRWVGTHRLLTGVSIGLLLVASAGAAGWLATRPPFPVREYQRALRLYESGDVSAANKAVGNALDGDTKFADAQFLRGRIRQAKGDYSAAINDYRTTIAILPDGRTRACLAYCLAQLDMHQEAIVEGNKAIKAGCDNPFVLNNLAHSYRIDSQLDKAVEWSSQAIAKRDDLQSAYFTRAKAILRAGLHHQDANIEQAADDIRRAIDLGPLTAQLFFDAACIEFSRAKLNPQYRSIEKIYLEQAVQLGMLPEDIARHPWFKGHDLSHVEKEPGKQKSTVEFLIDPMEVADSR